MGWSRGGLYIESASVNVAKSVALAVGLIDMEAAPLRTVADQSEIARGEVGIATINQWGVVLYDPKWAFAAKATLLFPELSVRQRIFFWLTDSVAAGLWFEMHEAGQMTRRWVESECVVLENYGAELPQEPEGFFSSKPDEEGERDEWAVLSLAHAITGFSENELFSVPFTVYQAASL